MYPLCSVLPTFSSRLSVTDSPSDDIELTYLTHSDPVSDIDSSTELSDSLSLGINDSLYW